MYQMRFPGFRSVTGRVIDHGSRFHAIVPFELGVPGMTNVRDAVNCQAEINTERVTTARISGLFPSAPP
jgi:hypothetical protein